MKTSRIGFSPSVVVLLTFAWLGCSTVDAQDRQQILDKYMMPGWVSSATNAPGGVFVDRSRTSIPVDGANAAVVQLNEEQGTQYVLGYVLLYGTQATQNGTKEVYVTNLYDTATGVTTVWNIEVTSEQSGYKLNVAGELGESVPFEKPEWANSTAEQKLGGVVLADDPNQFSSQARSAVSILGLKHNMSLDIRKIHHAGSKQLGTGKHFYFVAEVANGDAVNSQFWNLVLEMDKDNNPKLASFEKL